MSPPSIIPNDRLGRDFYIALEDFRSGAAFQETGDKGDDQTLITGQHGQVLRVVAFNPHKGWSRDASEDIARELVRHVSRLDLTIADSMADFIKGKGRSIRVRFDGKKRIVTLHRDYIEPDEVRLV